MVEDSTACCPRLSSSAASLSLRLHSRSRLRWGLTAYTVPILFAAGHIVHLERGFPRKPVVLLCTLLPAILFLIIGDIHLSVSYDLADQLFSTDCDTFASKR